MKTDYFSSYTRTLDSLIAQHGEARAMELIVGGQYETIGILEASLLRTLGLQPGHTVVDIGCGTGRLAWALREYLRGKYIGFDIVPQLLPHAVARVGRPDWDFLPISSPLTPLAADSSDMTCFFSVFTHIHDEDIHRYLAEAKRITRPGGLIVFSYLDFAVDWHWPVFEATLRDANPDRILNKFLSKDAIRAFARNLRLRVAALHDGPDTWITLTEPIRYEDGRTAEGTTYFGQSVCILEKT